MRASVIDLFCGAGGLAYGFKQEGFRLACGIDLDPACRFAFEKNNLAPFLEKDVSRISAKWLEDQFHPDADTRVLVGCAPCQPFSQYNLKNNDVQYGLVSKFSQLIVKIHPEIVSMENVSRLVTFRKKPVFQDFVRKLEDAGYHVWWDHVFCPNYGVPQMRRRLVLLASLLGELKLNAPSRSSSSYKTTRDAIGYLPKLGAGESDSKDPLHRSSNLSPQNRRRIAVAKPDGSWRDWPLGLVSSCHRRATGKGYGSVYGRMSWDKPSPTITTQFFGFGNGRFGHPDQNRALSLREGALLQSFPKKYEFVEPGAPICTRQVGRMIGNAVPILLSRAIARSIRSHLKGMRRDV